MHGLERRHLDGRTSNNDMLVLALAEFGHVMNNTETFEATDLIRGLWMICQKEQHNVSEFRGDRGQR